MGKQLVWDAVGEHYFEAGVDKVALFPYKNNAYDKGVAWSGVTAINEKPSGAEATDQFADNGKYLVIRSAEDFGFTIEAFQSPAEFDACDGSASIGKEYLQLSRQDSHLVLFIVRWLETILSLQHMDIRFILFMEQLLHHQQ